jgi:four helix bundle protein
VTLKQEVLQDRSKEFALRAIQLFRELPRTEEARLLGRQMMRSATSVAANYRATCRARSHAEFLAKMGVVVEEVDEAVFWLELLVEAQIVPLKLVDRLRSEAKELLAIFAASQRTARRTRVGAIAFPPQSNNDSMNQ